MNVSQGKGQPYYNNERREWFVFVTAINDNCGLNVFNVFVFFVFLLSIRFIRFN